MALLISLLPTTVLATTLTAKVVSVTDGDTLTVADSSTKQRVILYGIDCPEMGQEFGKEARQFTDSHCYGKTITLDDRGKDKLGRMIAVVFLPDGTNLNEELVAQGLAWWSDKYAANETKLKQLHEQAKAEQKGLWSASNPVPPWIFRNGSKTVQATIKSK